MCSDRYIRIYLINANGIPEQKTVTSFFENSCLAYLSFLTLTTAFVKVDDTQYGLKGTFQVYVKEKCEFIKMNIVI